MHRPASLLLLVAAVIIAAACGGGEGTGGDQEGGGSSDGTATAGGDKPIGALFVTRSGGDKTAPSALPSAMISPNLPGASTP
jgi:hypothetical protein